MTFADCVAEFWLTIENRSAAAGIAMIEMSSYSTVFSVFLSLSKAYRCRVKIFTSFGVVIVFVIICQSSVVDGCCQPISEFAGAS